MKQQPQFKTTALYSTVAVGLAMLTQPALAATPDYRTIGDLEIYQRPRNDAITITMMLDISGSMDEINDDYPNIACSRPQNFSEIIDFTNTNGIKENPTDHYTLRLKGCEVNGQRYYTRMDRLKLALVKLFADGTKLPADYKVGIGSYPLYGYKDKVSLPTGKMMAPAQALTTAHRKTLITQVQNLTPGGSTPAAQAYAEAGAYMMGTKTDALGPREKFILPLAQARNTSRNISDRGRLYEIFACDLEARLSFTGINVNITGHSHRLLSCHRNAQATAPNNMPNRFRTGLVLTRPIPGRASRRCYYETVTPDATRLLRDSPHFNLPRCQPPTPMRPHLKAKMEQAFGSQITAFYRLNNQTISPNTINRNTGISHIDYGITVDSNRPNHLYSGLAFSDPSTKKPDGRSYQSPLTTGQAQCSGQGIYFLTDGEPNSARNRNLVADIMNTSFDGTNRIAENTSLLPTQNSRWGEPSGWGFIGSYAQTLRNPNNPAGLEIKTATVGLGNLFTQNVDPDTGKVADCNTLPTVDAKNLCKLGQDIGGGGFTATSDPNILTQSVIDFGVTLNKTIPGLPAGSISIPSDPLNADLIQPYAYLPMLQPAVAKSSSIWQGNLKKYNTLDGTLYGKNNNRIYKASRLATRGNENYPIDINPDAQDLWQQNNTSDNSMIDVGGSRELLKNTANTSRVVYVEGGNAPAKLIKVQVENGTLTGGNQMLSAGYSFEELLHLVNYLGYDVSTNVSSYAGATDAARLSALQSKISSTAKRPEPVFGGINHSVPVLASYAGNFDAATGNVSVDESQRTDYMLYGSMDGALHMTNVQNGTEQFAFIPREMFNSQKEALKYDAKSNPIGRPYFGVDAPWSTSANYAYTDTSVTASNMYAYGGLRMGGVGLYGLDITDRSNPRLMYSINAQTTGFNRLGQTWAKPTKTKIKTGAGDNDYQDVLIFGGGYDMCYENPRFTLNDSTNTESACQNKTMAQGNAVYMIDAKTGGLLKSWSAPTANAQGISSASDDSIYMTHSIVSEIVPLDRNNNGFVDSLYVSDLGGQLFRIDLQEGVDAANASRRVVRVFNANGNLSAGVLPYRFYEKPLVSFYKHRGSMLAMVNIASGDRSSPIHKHRDSSDKANNIYGIIDKDLTTGKIQSNTAMSAFTTRNLTPNNLIKYDTQSLKTGTDTYRKGLIDSLKDGSKPGWYYPMTRFEDYTDVKHLKAIGSSIVTGSIYYTSIYSPDYQYRKTNSCAAQVLGATERQGFCLPWGICADTNGRLISGSNNGTLGYIKSGQGIQELALTTLTSTAGQSSRSKTFIDHQSITERNNALTAQGSSPRPSPTDVTNPFGGNATRTNDHNTLYTDAITSDVRVLKVKNWYDLSSAETN